MERILAMRIAGGMTVFLWGRDYSLRRSLVCPTLQLAIFTSMEASKQKQVWPVQQDYLRVILRYLQLQMRLLRVSGSSAFPVLGAVIANSKSQEEKEIITVLPSVLLRLGGESPEVCSLPGLAEIKFFLILSTIKVEQSTSRM